MKHWKSYKIIAAVVLAAALLVMLTLASASIHQARAESLALPTPVSAPASRAVTAVFPVKFSKDLAFTADGRVPAQELANYNVLDLQWVVDVGTVNTTTIKLQYSNDGSNWVDGATIASSIAADVVGLNQFQNFGRYTSIYVDVTNSNPITFTLIGVAK